MYDHAVFSLYSMSFMCLLFSLLSVIGYFNFSWQAWTLFIFIPPVHMFQQLRGTYKLSVGSALWRTGALLGVSNMVFILFLLFVVSIGLK
ncbi:hypothetical protein [Iodobacter sp.]|nr:hypothetical protein [Iodobacter sp.]